MRTITTNVFNYNKLDNATRAMAFEALKEQIIENKFEFFSLDIRNALNEDFPNSTLKVQYDFGGGQGTGLNIYGQFSLIDFFSCWDCKDEKLKRTIEFYINTLVNVDIELSYNNRYTYSMKFRDADNAEWEVEQIVNELSYERIANVNVKAIELFIKDMYKYLKEYEAKWYGYGEQCWEVSEDEIDEYCSWREYEFYEDGRIAA